MPFHFIVTTKRNILETRRCGLGYVSAPHIVNRIHGAGAGWFGGRELKSPYLLSACGFSVTHVARKINWFHRFGRGEGIAFVVLWALIFLRGWRKLGEYPFDLDPARSLVNSIINLEISRAAQRERKVSEERRNGAMGSISRFVRSGFHFHRVWNRILRRVSSPLPSVS